MIDLAVIIPVFNEEKTIASVLKKVIAVQEVSQIIIINDGSTDGSLKQIKKVFSEVGKLRKGEKLLLQCLTKKNGGKGSAVRVGLRHVQRKYVLIQDADTEYNPEDIPSLLKPIEKGWAEVVYGSRFTGPHLNLLFWNRVANSALNLLLNLCFNSTLSDMETCYKVMPTKLMKALKLRSNGFELEPEITCKILKSGRNIFEVPISYVGRDYDHGKKITGWDAFHAVMMIFRQRFFSSVWV